MNYRTPEQHARALELYNTWAAVEAIVLASHTCPDPDMDERVQAWDAIAKHPFFADCYHQTEGTLLGAALAKLDAAHTHTCEPVWRPTTAEEIQAGWEVRSRRPDGSEAGWGAAHDRGDASGDWYTESARLLTYAAGGWTYETTAPAPEPEPWPDELVDAITGTIWPIDRAEDARAVLDLLASKFPGVRTALTEGEQS